MITATMIAKVVVKYNVRTTTVMVEGEEKVKTKTSMMKEVIV